MNKGYIRLHRRVLDNPVIMKDAAHLAIWTYLLLEATHKNYDALFKGNRITLLPGQLLTGSKSIGVKLNINYIKVHRILKEFENEKQIKQLTSNRNRLITILKWQEYQDIEKQNENLLKNNCKTDEKQVKTNNNDNNVNNNDKEEIYKEEIYGSFKNVKLSRDEFQKLKNKFPDYADRIENLSFYIKSKGDKYKSHYATILNWARKENNNLPEWFDKDFKQSEEGLEELEKVLEDFK